MIVTEKNQRLYPATWTYNACRLMTHLAKIVENHDGRVKYYNPAIITNRTVTGAIHDLEHHLELVEKRIARDPEGKVVEYYNEKKQYLEKLKAIHNEPITVTHTTWILFVLDGIYYHYSVDDNPFFPFHYLKTPVENDSYHMDAYMVEDKKEWMYDCFFKMDCSEADIVEGANLIFNMLMNADCARIHRSRNNAKVNRYRKIDF